MWCYLDGRRQIRKIWAFHTTISSSHNFTALQVAQAYLNNIYKLHGLPQQMISDRDKNFTSSVWQQLFKLIDTQFLMSSSYHPQTDGQTERFNHLETFLRCTVHSCPREWHTWLPLAEFWYNTAFHSLWVNPLSRCYMVIPQDTLVLVIWQLVLYRILRSGWLKGNFCQN